MSEIVAVQQQSLIGPLPSWYAFVNPFAFALFVIANLAEVGRNPFDIPEAPTEIVAGYQTEYSSVYFVLIYLGEFIHIFLGGAIAATLFLGGPAGPVLPGFVWFTIKIWASSCSPSGPARRSRVSGSTSSSKSAGRECWCSRWRTCC